MEHICLNCNNQLHEKFCSNCGQKTSTHRYSIQHFVTHDLVHEILHVDKGVLYSIKELFMRPGHIVREYIQGKRVGITNFITLIIIILTASALLVEYTHIKLSDLIGTESSKQMMQSLEKFSTKYPKLFLLILIPINSFFSFLWFKKAKFNYSEHLVLNSYKTVATLFVGLLFSILTIFYTDIKVLKIIYNTIISGFGIFYDIWFFYQFFSTSGYSKKALIFRGILVVISFTMFTGITTAIYFFMTLKRH